MFWNLLCRLEIHLPLQPEVCATISSSGPFKMHANGNAYKMVAPSLLNLPQPGPFQSFGDRFCFQVSSNPLPPSWGRGSGCLSSSGLLSPSPRQKPKASPCSGEMSESMIFFSYKSSHGCYTGPNLELAEISFSCSGARSSPHSWRVNLSFGRNPK